jgi:lipopolysaccharide/colanic/teichoic acid biosynthesis glycosyltransferase
LLVSREILLGLEFLGREKTMSTLNVNLKTEKDLSAWGINATVAAPSKSDAPARVLLDEAAFLSMLYLERRRAERASKRFVLMLLDVRHSLGDIQKNQSVKKISTALSNATRETDIAGWYEQNSLVGVIGTELGDASPKIVRERLLAKVRCSFQEALGEEKASNILISFHFFPEEYSKNGTDHSSNITLYPDLSSKQDSKRFALFLKRTMDLAMSATALLFLSPVFAAIALAIKLSSKGPIFFRQERLGEHGKSFTFLKFRSMRTGCDARIHQEYVNQFIAGRVNGDPGDGAKPVFKIKNDPRVTPIGSLLRRTSLDELPQFWNVLCGEMSLVGPRPPIAYEFRAYDVWHRRRVLEIKPGITGLWQVEGRSRTQFDDMVRLDLKYARAWSLWLDLKILVRTPVAVLTGEGAH